MLHSQQHLLSVFKIYTSMNEMVFSIVWVCIVFHGWQWCSALYYVLGMGIAWFPLNTCTMFFPPSSFLPLFPPHFFPFFLILLLPRMALTSLFYFNLTELKWKTLPWLFTYLLHAGDCRCALHIRQTLWHWTEFHFFLVFFLYLVVINFSVYSEL